MAARVVSPARWISAITVRIVALALVVCSDLAEGTFAVRRLYLRAFAIGAQQRPSRRV
jgi:hypothetical protein